MAWICWHIWKARNPQIFNHVAVDPRMVIDKATREVIEFEEAQHSVISPHPIVNPIGKLIDGLAQEIDITSVFQGEALAFRLACVVCYSES
ncbi:hypothetical protein ACSBR2_023729 [Camellia fascicularis]